MRSLTAFYSQKVHLYKNYMLLKDSSFKVEVNPRNADVSYTNDS